MTAAGWVCAAIAALVAVVDWAAVSRSNRRIELVAKPTVLALLVLAAALAHPGDAGVKPWLIGALAFGLLGDVALLGASEEPPGAKGQSDAAGPSDAAEAESKAAETFFLLGLAAFALGHLSYLAAMLAAGLHPASAVLGLALAGGLIAVALRPIVRGAHRAGGPPLAGAVAGYAATLGATVALGVGTSILLVGVGSVAFAASDLVLGYDRFVRNSHWSRLTVIVTYHLAQFALLIGLVSSR